MKLDLTKPVQTRCGHSAKIIATDLIGSDYPIVAIIRCKDRDNRDYDMVQRFTIEGNAIKNETSDLDLINIGALDLTRPVKTRDGRNARIIYTDAKGYKPIIALILNEMGNEFALSFNIDGKVYDDRECDTDLVNIDDINDNNTDAD